MDRDDIRIALEGVRDRSALEALYAVAAELAGGMAAAWTVAQAVWRKEGETEAPLLRATDWAATVKDNPPQVVSDLIPAHSLILLGGKPKCGKTFWALQLAEDIATGAMALGRWKVKKPGPVVLLNMEDTAYQFRDRLRMRGTLERNPDIYVCKTRKDLSGMEGIAWLSTLVEDIQPSLVVIDTARQALRPQNWNDAAEVNAVTGPLKEFAEGLKHGSVLLVAHLNKDRMAQGGDRISGSNALQSQVDGYMLLDRVSRDADGDLTGICLCEGRIDMPAEFGWTMNHSDLHVRALDREDTQRRERAKDAVDGVSRVVDAVRALGGEATTADIARHLDMSVPHITSLVRMAAQAKRITSVRKVLTDGHAKTNVWGLSVDLSDVEVDV